LKRSATGIAASQSFAPPDTRQIRRYDARKYDAIEGAGDAGGDIFDISKMEQVRADE
jgi:hypothetical protein